jgi:transposase InsO family protein
MSRATSPSTGKRYGLAQVCRVWRVARSTVYWRRSRAALPPDQRPAPQKRGPRTGLTDAELTARIRTLLTTGGFHGEGHRKVWARLRLQGVRTSKGRVLRLMRRANLLAPQRVGRPRGPRAHDGTIITDRPDVMWGTDLTMAWTTRDGPACVFLAVDHCTAECVGLHACKRGTRFQALEPLRQAVRASFGRYDAGVATGVAVRHDHGSVYLSATFQDELAYLGITSSPAFVREPEGNGCAERFVRVLKENLLWVESFATVAELQAALTAFKRRYNEEWLIERHGFRPPAQVRADLATPPARAA